MFYLSFAIFSCLSCVALASAPEGFQLISGEAKPPVIGPDGTMTISSGKHAIVHWDKFSIGPNTAVKFAQADQTSAILNRVVGSAESRIDGALLSNGKVFLVNQNGVVVGPNGRIDTAGFIASTLDITNDDFLRGKELLFNGDSKQKVINLGMIVANEGDIVLIGQCIDNQGTLNAPHGHVLLGCGQAILLQPSGEERIFIRIPASEPASLEHSGTIEALVAEMKSGVTPFAKAIKSSGRIDALATVEENGKVFLVAEEGRVDVSGSIVASSGNIHLLGKEVYLLDGADIDASGDKAGGEILVGGDYQGSNPNIPNADISYVAKNAKLHANANTEGDGGKVIIWAEKATGFFGHIEARGGAESGNGGLVEVSADRLTFEGFSDTRAPKGKSGTLLLDPTDVTISDTLGPDTCPVTCWSGGTYTPDSPTCTNPNVITSNQLTQFPNGMLLNNDVTINTASPCGNSTFGGRITVDASLTWFTPHSLTLDTTNGSDIVFNNATLFTTNGGVTLNAATNITFNAGGITNYVLPINITANGNLAVLSGALIQSNGSNVNLNIGGSFTCADSNVEAGNGGALTANIGTDCAITSTGAGASVFGFGPCNLTIGGNLTMSGTGSSTANINSEASTVLVLVGGTASITDSVISTNLNFVSPGGTDVTLVVDNNNPSPPNIGSQNPMLKVTAGSNITSNGPGTFVRIFTATQGQNTIDPTATFGNGSPPTTFTPGTPFVDTATEMWGTYYPSSAGGNPYTFFYKDTAPSPPGPSPSPAPSPAVVQAAAVATTSSAVNNTAVTNLITTQQNSLTIITTPTPTSGGQAIPLTPNSNENAVNDAMSQAQCP